MSKFEIEIPELPEGWKPVAYRRMKEGEDYFCFGAIQKAKFDSSASAPALIVEKIKPKRIILEATGKTRRPEAGEYVQHNGNFCLCRKPERWGCEHEIWREVKEEEE